MSEILASETVARELNTRANRAIFQLRHWLDEQIKAGPREGLRKHDLNRVQLAMTWSKKEDKVAIRVIGSSTITVRLLTTNGALCPGWPKLIRDELVKPQNHALIEEMQA